MLIFYLFTLIGWVSLPAVALLAILVSMAFFLTRKNPAKTWIAVTTATVGALLCVILWGVETASYTAVISHEFIDPAPTQGTLAFCKLGKGYDLQMSQDWASAYLLHDPAWTGSGTFPERYNVIRLQIANDLIFGESSIHGNEGPFFVLDSSNGTMRNAKDLSHLYSLANASGVKLSLKPAKDVYYDHRPGRIPFGLWAVFCISATAVTVGLGIWFYRLGQVKTQKTAS